MIIDENQKDAITEVINTSFGRVADSLSRLTGHRVSLEAPKISVLPMSKTAKVLK